MNLKIYADIIENEAREQIDLLLKQDAFKDAKVRIMPDVHAGKGCVIGFTADLGDKVIPNIVGVDIGCGMLVVDIGKVDIDFQKLDRVIKQNIPSGLSVNKNIVQDYPLELMKCFPFLINVDRLKKSLGSLGGGNHFIEIDENKSGHKFLIIHSGSRNLGLQVAKHYQNKAIKTCHVESDLIKQQEILINSLKSQGRENEIESSIKELKKEYYTKKYQLPNDLCYLTGEDREGYLHDMRICQEWASINRKLMAKTICTKMGWRYYQSCIFETIHNYIAEDNIVRKGAISAKENEMLLIPMNMRDGCIIGVGKGNEDWNNSAPHGAGRIMSRAAAKKNVDIEEFKKSMEGIYTSTVSEKTLDEAPMAYKPKESIVNAIKDTVKIIDIIKPIYNFKAEE